ncbi:uncharacterized protein PSFLO_00601 [Pseudozyma flocculosa]|uniref:Uncharacterized protein n=1 Tax=Pseudozyma flocculosa TaxID=84751 RepID=A0A5C3ETG9_9BASI|nr:uncharacterized protein PSFLO_00601 [Pseudozyma flocculosa]
MVVNSSSTIHIAAAADVVRGLVAGVGPAAPRLAVVQVVMASRFSFDRERTYGDVIVLVPLLCVNSDQQDRSAGLPARPGVRAYAHVRAAAVEQLLVDDPPGLRQPSESCRRCERGGA